MANIPNEDRLRDQADACATHRDPHSPYYDGPIVGEDCCSHGVAFEEDCEDCDEEFEEERMNGITAEKEAVMAMWHEALPQYGRQQ
jgi:hypothetical protein